MEQDSNDLQRGIGTSGHRAGRELGRDSAIINGATSIHHRWLEACTCHLESHCLGKIVLDANVLLYQDLWSSCQRLAALVAVSSGRQQKPAGQGLGLSTSPIFVISGESFSFSAPRFPSMSKEVLWA